MEAPTARRLAWILGGLALATLAAGAALGVATDTLSDQLDTPPVVDVLFATVLATFPVMGVLIATRQPENRIGWLFCAIGLATGLATLGGTYGDANPPLPGREWATLTASFGLVGLALQTLVMLLFPDGRLLSPRWRIAVWIDVVAAVTLVAGFTLTPGPIPGQEDVVNPLGVDALDGSLLDEGGVGWVLLPIALIAAAVSMVMRFRRAAGVERQQMKWFALAAVFLALGYLLSAVTHETPLQDSFLVALVVQFGVAALPVAAGIAILRYRLYEIDLVISKAVVYGVLGGFITLVYIGFVVGIGALAENVGNAFLSAIAAAVVAIAFQPVRRWAQRLANRVVYGKRATPYEVLTEFSERMGGAYAADDVLPRMAQILGQGTGASSATVWLMLDGRMRPAASWPMETAVKSLPTGAVEVSHRGEMLGALSVEMPSNDPMNPATEKLVGDLAAQAGLVLRNVRLVEDLRESRRRIVAAQDERAKKLERDIHDGAQQQLVALAVKQRLAESLVGEDDEQARLMLAEIRAETNDALGNLRDLARGIYPPLLADQGLGAALEAQARKAAVPVGVDTDGVGRYPQEVESAVYFSVLEALQNVAKYARAEHVDVRLNEGGGELRFEVEDDGVGFDVADVHAGTGLQGITDRLAALGGEVDVRSIPRQGTIVAGVIGRTTVNTTEARR
ncbi:MAG: histidine kinase [Actinomycetota bacterium]